MYFSKVSLPSHGSGEKFIAFSAELWDEARRGRQEAAAAADESSEHTDSNFITGFIVEKYGSERRICHGSLKAEPTY